ncbi:MAG TPA: hypothetical protein VHS03_03925 [Gaiellaceae bacterium]|nr:hypothetical protein [Gaiellaceae bacterium]
MARPWRVLVIALVVGALAVTGAVASAVHTGTLSPKLVGKWSRKATSADVKRTGGIGITPGSVWTLTIKKNDYAAVEGSAGGFEGYMHPVGSSRIRTNVAIGIAVYGWHVSGNRLTLTKVSDQTPDREAVFEGVWKKK